MVVPLSRERDAVFRVVATDANTLYLYTDRGAPRRRVVVFDIRNPAVEHWRDVVPQTDDVIDELYDIGDRFVVKYLRKRPAWHPGVRTQRTTCPGAAHSSDDGGYKDPCRRGK
jgi:hypothetical protein